MRRRRSAAFRCPLLLVPLLFASCADDTADRPPLETVEAAAFTPALFDSVTWEDDRAALDRGATVYAYSCAKCHGDSGRGDGGYVLDGRLLRPPSFLADDWRFASDLPGLRQAILEGNDKGMPHWGRAGLSPRDMDAVARYITRRLWGRM